MSRPKRVTECGQALTLWPAPNLPGTNQYRTRLTNALDTRQEFVRADYNASGELVADGRYLHERVDSRGDYTTGPDLEPGHRYLLGHLAVVEARHVGGRLLWSRPTSCRNIAVAE